MTKKQTDGWTADDIPDQTGRRFVITGGNSGIGLEAARMLAGAGGDVLITSRSVDKGQAALDDLRSGDLAGSVDVAQLDLADLASVRSFAESVLATNQPIDVLINNAGVMATPYERTADGFELQLGTNHLGHFALTGLLIERIGASEDARVVNVSSLAHRQGKIDFDDLMSEEKYSRFGAYGQSKLANLLFTMELHRRRHRRGDEILALACHPGMSATNLGQGMSDGLLGKITGFTKRFETTYTQTAADGALPTVRAACDPKATGGDYFGPDGFGELRGKAVKVKAKPKAYDVHDARALWERSVELTGVDY